jgi:undecaprenyl-diphosphatase
LVSVNSLIVFVAQYVLYLILAAAAAIWLYLPRPDKVSLAAQTFMSLVIVFLLITLAAAIYTDPRPFVVNPSIRPLFAHGADNGFPSDHTAVAVTVALLVMMYRRWLGAALLLASIALGSARVAAHVHHVPDIVVAVLIAALAAVIASAIWRWVRPHLPRQLTGRVST